MRKTYGLGYPRTLGALIAWSGLGPEAPAVTDAAGTLNRCAFQNRVLGLAAGHFHPSISRRFSPRCPQRIAPHCAACLGCSFLPA